jgi:hypothetical protein
MYEAPVPRLNGNNAMEFGSTNRVMAARARGCECWANFRRLPARASHVERGSIGDLTLEAPEAPLIVERPPATRRRLHPGIKEEWKLPTK